MEVTDRPLSLLDLDPELGRLLDDARRPQARHDLIVDVRRVDPGPWDDGRPGDAGPGGVGLLLVDGLIARELALADNVSCELLGPGDLIPPRTLHDPARALGARDRWTVLDGGALAVLDHRLAPVLMRYPEVNAMLIDRLAQRAHRLAVSQAISRLTGVDRRLLALFWHLAERWGKVGPGGVTVTIPVPHRLIAELVGARRPTVSTALGALAERELLTRDGQTWRLAGDPVGVPTAEAARVIRARRSRFDRDAPPSAGERETPPAGSRLAAIHESLRALRTDHVRFRRESDELRERAGSLIDELNRRRDEKGSTP
jgi:CRP/FNR family cyclic AMP-dependent transcriptional regulator